MSFTQLIVILNMDNADKSLTFLTDHGILDKGHVCNTYGGSLHKAKQGNIWYWICYRCLNGMKWNRGKFGVRKASFLDHTHLTIQNVTRMIWNFVYGLNINQCKHLCSISKQN